MYTYFDLFIYFFILLLINYVAYTHTHINSDDETDETKITVANLQCELLPANPANAKLRTADVDNVDKFVNGVKRKAKVMTFNVFLLTYGINTFKN